VKKEKTSSAQREACSATKEEGDEKNRIGRETSRAGNGGGREKLPIRGLKKIARGGKGCEEKVCNQETKGGDRKKWGGNSLL